MKMARKKEAAVYAYDPELREISPMTEGKIIPKEEALAAFMSHPLMFDTLKGKNQKGSAEVLAEAKKPEEDKVTAGAKGEETESRTYSLSYFNPETNKAEIIEGKTDIKFIDHASRMIEEAIGIGSVYPIYAFVASPLMRTEVVQWRLEQILSEREYGTPPSFGGASAIRTGGKRAEAKESEIVSVRQEEEQREAVIVALTRKEGCERRLDEEIAVFEEVIAAIRKGETPESALKMLPPLSRARYLVAMKKKRLEKKALLSLLGKDLRLSKSIKKKLETLTAKGLLGLVRLMKKIKGE